MVAGRVPGLRFSVRAELALPHTLVHPYLSGRTVVVGDAAPLTGAQVQAMGMMTGLRQAGRRPPWLVLPLTAAVLVILWLLLPGNDDAGPIETPIVTGGDSPEAPGNDAGGPDKAVPSAPDDSTSGTPDDTAAADDIDEPTPPPGRGSAAPDLGNPDDVLAAFLALSDEMLADPDGAADVPLARLATDAALQEVRSMALEFSVAGLRQTGQHEVVSMVSGPIVGDEVSIEVCLDRSTVDLLHADGARVLVEQGDQRSLHTYVLRHSETGWQVAAHGFPEPNTC